ncbi:hypothetical protein NQ317_014067 [Molorchus minor]|uniref:DNA-3-methyladenine glycosylase II n=1 Tax=Molorchus minor TaxID=1323400 RepID=A0ABQ9JFF0_9CUCU|nr:hypothetical protein NQ317_014067 [Molorchus minor]
MTNKNSVRLLKEDIDKPCKELSLYLLGKILVRKLEDDTILKGRIVETESYPGGEDRGEPLQMNLCICLLGHVSVYMTYGMYYCFNISSTEPGASVLVRALEPICGLEAMESFRAQKAKKKKVLKSPELANGPSKLCMAMNITKDKQNKLDLTDLQNDQMWLEDDPEFDDTKIKVVHTTRNESVSKRDKKAEKDLDPSLDD